MDHPYTFWEQTPLKWHKFITYFYFPFQVPLLACYRLPGAWSALVDFSGTGLAWIGMVDIIYIFLAIGLCAGAFVGNMARNRLWSGPLCVIGFYLLCSAYAIFTAVIFIAFQVGGYEALSNVVTAFVYLVGAWLNCLYYRKRRLLFRPMPGVPQHRAGAAPQPDVPSAQPAVCDSPSVPQQEEPVQACSSASPSAPVPPSGMAASRASRPFSKKVLFGCAFFLLELLLLSGCYLCASKMVEAQMQADITKSYYDGWAEGYQAGVEDGKSLSRESNLSEERLERYQQANETIAKRDAEWERSREEHWGSRIVYVTKNGEKYHTDGCSYLTGSEEEITVRQALEDGYTPCSRCDPPTI